MRIPGPTWKRRSTSAASPPSTLSRRAPISPIRRLPASTTGSSRLPLVLALFFGIAATVGWHSSVADQPPKPLHPLKVTEYESGSTWTYVEMEGSDIGMLDLDEIREGELSAVVELLQRHREWTSAGEDLRLTAPVVTERHVSVRQLVHGIRVGTPIGIWTDQHGNVVQLSSAIVDPEAIRDMPTILQDDAVAIATEALRNHLGQSNSIVHILRNQTAQPTLYLDPQADMNGPVRFYWRMYMRALGGSHAFTVKVDAHSGDSEVRRR